MKLPIHLNMLFLQQAGAAIAVTGSSARAFVGGVHDMSTGTELRSGLRTVPIWLAHRPSVRAIFSVADDKVRIGAFAIGRDPTAASRAEAALSYLARTGANSRDGIEHHVTVATATLRTRARKRLVDEAVVALDGRELDRGKFGPVYFRTESGLDVAGKVWPDACLRVVVDVREARGHSTAPFGAVARHTGSVGELMQLLSSQVGGVLPRI